MSQREILNMAIPFFKSYHDENDIKRVSDVIERGMYWANGPEIREFEDRMAEYIGSRYCLSFNSGTSALHALLESLDIRGSEVIVPSFTFIATSNSVIMAGGKPVFADIETESFGMDPEDIIEKVTDKTKAIMPVHYGGYPCRIGEIKNIADDLGLLLIEDAAESLGARTGDRCVSTIGDAGMISFTPTKVISTGEGGVILTDEKEIYEKMKLLRSHGRNETEDYFSSIKYMDYISLGYNYRMPTICAALGISQLEKVEGIIERRRRIADMYTKGLSNIRGIEILPERIDSRNVYQMFPVILRDTKSRGHLQDRLVKGGISTKVYFHPVHETHYYREILKYDTHLEVTEDISRRVLCLPIYPDLKDEQIVLIIKRIVDILD